MTHMGYQFKALSTQCYWQVPFRYNKKTNLILTTIWFSSRMFLCSELWKSLTAVANIAAFLSLYVITKSSDVFYNLFQQLFPPTFSVSYETVKKYFLSASFEKLSDELIIDDFPLLLWMTHFFHEENTFNRNTTIIKIQYSKSYLF